MEREPKPERLIDVYLIPHEKNRHKSVVMTFEEIITAAERVKEVRKAGNIEDVVVSVVGKTGTKDYPVKDMYAVTQKNNR